MSLVIILPVYLERNTHFGNMGSIIKLINLPWTVTRQDLARQLNRILDTRVKYSRIMYDRETGLSRGIGVVQLDSEQLARDIIRRGTLDLGGRTVIVARENRYRQQQRQSQESLN